MKKRAILLFVLTMLLISTAASYSYAYLASNKTMAINNVTRSKYKEGELLVKFKPSAKKEAKTGIHTKLGSKIIREFAHLRIHHVKLRQGESVEKAIEKYMSNPNVEFAEPNYFVAPDIVPRDTDFTQLWALNNTGQTGGTADADIDGPEAWDITTGSSGVIVAVIDTGVDYGHTDLVANMWVNPGEKAGDKIDNDGNGYIDDIYGINVVNNTGNPMDDHSHGTHVAGTIGAVGNNRKGVTGVNWNVKIMALKFIDGQTGRGSVDAAIECFEYVRMMKARGVNIVITSNSWGGAGDAPQALHDAIAAQQDILCVAAAGNYGLDNSIDPHWPASIDLPNVIAVAATDKNDKIATWSNYGSSSVHIGAPGVDILSTIPGGGYDSYSGTSMAAPHVSGVAALLKAQSSSRDMKTIKNLLLSGGDDIQSLDGKTMTGKRLNAYGSLTRTDGAVLKALAYPLYPTADSTHTLTVLSIKGAEAVGPVTVTAGGSQVATLYDNGIAPDRYANDGLFAGAWTALAGDTLLTFSSAAGSQTININPLAITNHKLRYATIGTSYSDYFKAKGGKSLYAWSVVSGALPPGLSLNTSTGEVSGVPTIAGVYEFTIQVTDGEQTVTLATKIEADYAEVWAHDTGNDDRVENMAIGDNDSVYVAGFANNGANLDCQLVKFTPMGTVDWVRTYDGGANDLGMGVAVDAGSNAYMTGYARKSTYDVFVTMKYDAQGNLIWLQETNNSVNGQRAESIALDSSGNVIIAGNSGWPQGIVLVKLDQNGNQLWFKKIEGSCAEIAVDSSDNIYITGGGQTIKCDSLGNVVWTRPFTIGQGGTPLDVALDSLGNVYVTGYYSPASGARDLLTIKYDAAGNMLWSKTYATSGDYIANGLTVDASGVAYIAATANSSRDTSYCLTVAYDALGNEITSKQWNLADYDNSEDVAINSSGNVLIAGYAANKQFGTDTIQYDVFVIKYGDLEPPAVTAFDVPENCDSRTVPVTVLSASDNKAVTGYLITESSAKPSLSDPKWSAMPPASYTVDRDGTITLYAWAKDGSGNISSGRSDTVTVSTMTNTIAVTKAEYLVRTKTLTVYATSNYGATAALQVEGYGSMSWNAKYSRWEKVVTDLANAPATVTVFGPEGSKTVPVTIK